VVISLSELCVVVTVFNRSTTIMYTVRNLHPGCVYQFSVTAENEAGEGSPSHPSNPVTVPEECVSVFCLIVSSFSAITLLVESSDL